MKNPLFFLFIFFLFACTRPKCYEKQFPEAGWEYADSLDFSFEITDTSAKDLILSFSVNDEYPYRNLYLQFRVIPPKGKKQSSLTNFILMNSEGKWYVSKSLFTEEYEFSKPVARNLHFPGQGKYVVRIIQFMRDDTLQGITKLKLCIK